MDLLSAVCCWSCDDRLCCNSRFAYQLCDHPGGWIFGRVEDEENFIARVVLRQEGAKIVREARLHSSAGHDHRNKRLKLRHSARRFAPHISSVAKAVQ